MGPIKTHLGPLDVQYADAGTNIGLYITNFEPVGTNSRPVDDQYWPLETNMGPVLTNLGPVDDQYGPKVTNIWACGTLMKP